MRTVAGPSRGAAQRWSDWPQWPAHTLNPPYSRAAATASFLAIPNRLESAIRLPEHEVRGEGGLQRGAAGLGLTGKGRTKVRPTLCSRQNGDAWPPGGTKFHRERRLENLFEQFALINVRGRTDAQATAALHQDDLIGILRGEIQFVRHDHDGVAIFACEAAESVEQADLRSDIQVEGGLIEQEEQGLLGQSTREDHALLFAAGNLIHPAIAEIGSTDLGEGVFRNQDIFFGFKTQRPAIGMAALQDKFPSAGGEEQGALLLNHGDTLRAVARREGMRDKTTEQYAARERRKGASNQFQQGGFTAGIGAENGDDFARPGLKARCFQSEEGGLRGVRRIRVADLLDTQAYVVSQAPGFGKMSRVRGSSAHASLLRSR